MTLTMEWIPDSRWDRFVILLGREYTYDRTEWMTCAWVRRVPSDAWKNPPTQEHLDAVVERLKAEAMEDAEG